MLPRLKWQIFWRPLVEVLYAGMAGIHQHLVEIPPWPALIAQIAHSYPTVIRVLAGLAIQVQVDILSLKSYSSIFSGFIPLFTCFSPTRPWAIYVCQPYPDRLTSRDAAISIAS